MSRRFRTATKETASAYSGPESKSQVFVNAPTGLVVRRRSRSAGARDGIGPEQLRAARRFCVGAGESHEHSRRLWHLLRLVADERDHERVSGSGAVRNAVTIAAAAGTVRRSFPRRESVPDAVSSAERHRVPQRLGSSDMAGTIPDRVSPKLALHRRTGAHS